MNILNKNILIVDDERMVRRTLSYTLSEWRFVPIEATDVKSALEYFDRQRPALTLLDINLPDGSGLDALRTIRILEPNAKVVMITAAVLVENVIAALRAGACDFIAKPIDINELQIIIQACLPAIDNEESTSASPNLIENHNSALNKFGFENIIGESEKIKEMISLARKVAVSDVSSVLLQGESGTGKDLIAKAIHSASARAAKPFVAINCAALPPNLIEAELFGYEKGAFTDAKGVKEGLFEQAKGGTIFLDEIGELELSLQAKLLRVIEGGAFRRVGGLRDMPLNARIIAASNRNLERESDAGKFRSDLYYRLAVIEIVIPPLRERGDDVLLLAAHFIEMLDRYRFKGKTRRLAPETIRAFRQYQWIGNVRELRNAIERALILEDGEQITLKALPAALRRCNSSNNFLATNNHLPIQLPVGGVSLEAVEDTLIEQALRRTEGNITRAAAILHISRDRMRYYLKKKKLDITD